MTELIMLFASVTNTFDLPKGLVSSVCYVESNHRVQAFRAKDGKSASYGVCQIKLATAQWLGFKGTEKELMLPANNVYYAAKYLRYHLNRYDGDVSAAVAAYNAGSYRVDETGMAFNHYYVKKVFHAWIAGR